MSVEAVHARVAELSALLDRAQSVGTGRAAVAANGGTFAEALAGAQGAAAAPAPAPATLASAGALTGPVYDGAPAATTSLSPPAAPAALVPGTRASAGAGEAALGPVVDAAARRHGVDPALLRALVKQESGFNPQARSGAGAVGLGQLMPGTAAGLGVTDPTDPVQSADGAARYLRDQLKAFGGDASLALAAYNAGPNAVRRFGGVPPYAETQHYVQRVTALAAQYRSGGLA